MKLKTDWRMGLRQGGDLLRFVVRRFGADSASRMAAALSYTSLLSLVPLLAIALAVLAAFPAFGHVRAQMLDWAFANLVPAVGSVVQEQMNRFIANAGRLTAAGIIGLGVSAIMLLVTIEGAFNAIFRVTRERSPVSRLLVYWTVLTLGPLLMGAALSLQGYMAAAGRWQLTRTVSPYVAVSLPFVLTTLAFAIMFATLPNRRVRLGDALAGALASGVMFTVLRWGFGLYVTSSQAYTNLYGAVAAVPILLLWMFLSWVVVLAGAELTAALPEWRAGLHRAERGPQGARRLSMALEILARLHNVAANGGGGVARNDLAAIAGEHELAPVLERLFAANLAAPTTGRKVLLARDLGTATLRDLVRALQLDLSLDPALSADASWRGVVEQRLHAAHRAHDDALNVHLKELLE